MSPKYLQHHENDIKKLTAILQYKWWDTIYFIEIYFSKYTFKTSKYSDCNLLITEWQVL